MTQSKESGLKFEDQLKRLEDIVGRMESGDLTLDESLKLYEEGVKLSQSCTKRLDEAQKRIEVLLRTGSGELKTVPADDDLKPKKSKK